jgi:hypothetical protein
MKNDITLCTADKFQNFLFLIENGSERLSIRPFSAALFRTSTIERIISRRSLNVFLPTFLF